MKRLSISNFIQILCIPALVLSAASCNKNDLFPDGKGSSSQIRLSVKSGEPYSKASDACADPGELIASYALSEDPENDLFLNVYERDFSEEPVTKGEVKTTSKLSTFKMLAYANGEWHDNTIADGQPGSATSPHAAGLYFGGTDGIDVNRSGSAGSYDWNIATDQYWLNEVSISFWSWNGVKPAVAWNSSTSCYDKASLTGFTVAGVNGTEVTSQIDPIFAYNGEYRKFDEKEGRITAATSSNSAYKESDSDRADNQVDIHFYHALSAVNFDISEVGAGHTVDNIKLSNVYSVGDCDITVSGGIPQFGWKNLSGKAYFAQAFTASDFNASDPQKGRQPLETSDKVFLMIPQTLSAEATITVTFNGTPSAAKQIYLKGSPDGTTPVEWKAGKYYTYAIQRSGDVQLDIMGPLEPVKTATVDSHYESVMLRISKTKPGASKVDITDQNGTAQTAFDPLVASTPTYADWIRFAAPTDESTFAGYPGLSGSTDISGLLQELAGDGTKAHFYDDGTFYYTQAFVNEYVVGSGPSEYVGKTNRKFKITLSKDNTISSSDPSVEIGQKAMQSPYNLSTAANPFGVEVVEESSVTVGDGTTAADWCLSRNRDENGNGSIEGSEIKWRTPSLQEYWNIWYGTHGMSAESWLGLESSKARTQYLSSDGLAYNGQLSTTVTTPSGTGTVRCIRDLGSGSNAMYSFAEVPGILDNGETTTKYVLTMNGISSGSMRTKISSNELTAGTINPGAGTDAQHNKLYSKIQVASQYLTWPTGGTTTVPTLLYYLAVEKDRAKSIDDYVFNVTYNSSGNITLIEGSVKMINPDPRLVYISSFAGTTGGKGPDDNWSMVDENGVLHFRVESSGWTANNSGLQWDIKAAINNGNGTFTDLEKTPKICTLVFYVNNGSGSNFNNPWGQTFNINKVGNITLIGDGCIALGSSERYCRLGVQDAGPYTLTDVKFPEVKEEFDGTTEGKDDKPSADYLCKTYYYEDQRSQSGTPMKADLGQWRAPSQRELSIMLTNREDLKIMRATPKGTGEYEWSKVDWAITDKVFSPRITYSDGATNSYKYYNYNGFLSNGGSAQVPYKIRCVRDIE